MGEIIEIKTANAPKPLPVFSQAIKANGMAFCSGNIGLDKDTWMLVGGGIIETVYDTPNYPTSFALPYVSPETEH